MNRDTKIICTLGPASSNEKILLEMAAAGMNIVRLNFSHGSHDSHQKVIDIIKKINKETRHNIKIMQDLEGYRIRVGFFEEPKELRAGQLVTMSVDKHKRKSHIPFDFLGDLTDIKKGYEVFIDDGQICLDVLKSTKKIVELKVLQAGLLKQRKGLNIPELKLKSNIMTEKDKRDIEFGIQNEVDYVAQSFVRNKKDVERVSKILKKKLPSCKLISKIENAQGVHNVDAITDACDGVIVARGDLGVSMPIYKIPIMQKYIITRCNKKKKMSIVATQMLESMTEHPRPTRAEVTDVANAVLDGADCVMLSGETAVGKYPAQTIQMMKQVICYAEEYINPYKGVKA